MGLLHDNNTGWKGYMEGRCTVYRPWRGHRKERYIEALVGGARVEGGRVYRFWGDHKKAEYIKVPAGSDDFCFCDLQGKCSEGN